MHFSNCLQLLLHLWDSILQAAIPALSLEKIKPKYTSYLTSFLLSVVTIGVRAVGARGAAAPPKFWATQTFWATRESLGKASF